MSQIIQLTRGFVTEVDDVDAFYLSLYTWHCNRSVGGNYARRVETKPKRHVIEMHNAIAERMGLIGRIDHKDRDTLNNKRENLRLATRSQNAVNTGPYTSNTSGYKGVSWNSQYNKWHASIRVNGETIHLGIRDSAVEAALLYDEAAKHHHPIHGYVNFSR